MKLPTDWEELIEFYQNRIVQRKRILAPFYHRNQFTRKFKKTSFATFLSEDRWIDYYYQQLEKLIKNRS